ncbi:MAG: hypothetical protein HY294_11095 [Candidatus Rokubacteria bacterium]|nr:hypothetical protein [Candidatus Rokubacteria bacterium]MBI3826532.1 hypothetical protein [Candidatus Rokubacteria bacterium]
MDGALTTAEPRREPTGLINVGRPFVSPAFDYLFIGGVLSIAVGVVVFAGGLNAQLDNRLWYMALFANSAHFAASTVRLYTKRGAYRRWPVLTAGFPLAVLGVLALALAAEPVTRGLFALYLIWSAFHYAAQAYGLSVMYAYRSGCELDTGERWLLRGASLVPFAFALVSPQTALVLVLPSAVLAHPVVADGQAYLTLVLWALVFVTPILAFARLARRGVVLPAISVLVLYANAVWWTFFTFFDAFAWATVFHGLQYLAIVMIFHVKDEMRLPDNRHGRAYHAAWFYAVALAGGWALFIAWPHSLGWLGFDFARSVMITAALVNIHHFVVDAYIWKLRRDPNYQTVVDAVPVQA